MIETSASDCGHSGRRVATVSVGYGLNGPAYETVCPGCLACHDAMEPWAVSDDGLEAWCETRGFSVEETAEYVASFRATLRDKLGHDSLFPQAVVERAVAACPKTVPGNPYSWADRIHLDAEALRATSQEVLVAHLGRAPTESEVRGLIAQTEVEYRRDVYRGYPAPSETATP